MTRQIKLSLGQVALVDEEDFERVSKHKWYAWWSADTKSYYAYRTMGPKRARRTWYLHRVILGLEHGDKREGDHINRNTLDCTRSNLRIVSSAQNKWNSGMRRDNTLGFTGVKRSGKKFTAEIKILGKSHYLGTRETAEQAYVELYLPAAMQRSKITTA
jgi:hypothetical protein